MKQEMLFANCSESTMRLNISELSEAKIKELHKKLLKLILETQEENEKINPNISMEKLQEKFDSESYETNVYEDMIFGTKALIIDGDFPYNNSEVLNSFAIGNNLKFEYDNKD